MFAGFYILGVYYLNKINKKYALFFVTSPLILIEGLMNNHNDFIALSLGLTGMYFLLKNKKIYSLLFLILSAGIKYITIPIIFLTKNIRSLTNKVVFCAIILILLYLSIFFEIQPWYFLALFLFIPFFYNLASKLNIFFAGLLFSYFPFIAYGDWGMGSNLKIKHSIVVIFFIINIIYLFMYNFSNAKKTSK